MAVNFNSISFPSFVDSIEYFDEFLNSFEEVLLDCCFEMELVITLVCCEGFVDLRFNNFNSFEKNVESNLAIKVRRIITKVYSLYSIYFNGFHQSEE